MKVLVTGAEGMLGSDFCLFLRETEHTCIATDRQSMDVTDLARVRQVIAAHRPDLVVHAAAHTDADQAELTPDIAYRVNTLGTWNVALACAAGKSQLVYVSSCGVFDGTKPTPYTELDPPNPITQHHRSKVEGERLVSSLLREHFILRPGWLFGGRADHRRNFIARRYREAIAKTTIVTACDRFGSPTYTMDFARAAMEVVESQAFGLYHVANAGVASRFDYVAHCVEALGLETRVDPVTSDAFPRSAPIPVSEALDCYYLRLRGFTMLPPWRQSLSAYVETRLLHELNATKQPAS